MIASEELVRRARQGTGYAHEEGQTEDGSTYSLMAVTYPRCDMAPKRLETLLGLVQMQHPHDATLNVLVMAVELLLLARLTESR